MSDNATARMRLELACQEALAHLTRGEFHEAPAILCPVIEDLGKDELLALGLSRELEVLIHVASLCAARNPQAGSPAVALFAQAIELRLRTLTIR
jgi:hypothetical protein